MWKFYADIGWRLLKSLRIAVYAVEAFVGVVWFILPMISQSWASYLQRLTGLHPQWAWVPIAIVFAHLIMRAIYCKFRDQETAHAAEIKTIRNEASQRESELLSGAAFSSVEAEKAKALQLRLADVKRSGEQHASGAPKAQEFTPQHGDAWVVGAYRFLEKTVHHSARTRFTLVGPTHSYPALAESVADFRGVIADLRAEDLREASQQQGHDDTALKARQADESRRLENAKTRIRQMIDIIPAPGGSPFRQINPAMILRALDQYGEMDWKIETKTGLRALVNEGVCKEYEKCFKQKRPALAARTYLTHLEQSLKYSDLR